MTREKEGTDTRRKGNKKKKENKKQSYVDLAQIPDGSECRTVINPQIHLQF